jgi:hypothetical protein
VVILEIDDPGQIAVCIFEDGVNQPELPVESDAVLPLALARQFLRSESWDGIQSAFVGDLLDEEDGGDKC